MKTSNKLLIAFAVLMFIIPLTIMAVTINNTYKDASEIKKQEDVNTHFSTRSNGFTSIKLKKAFNAVNIAGGKSKIWYVNLVNDNGYGVKVSELYKDLVTVSIDVNGNLQIDMKEGDEKIPYAITIYVYGPKIKELNIAKASVFTLAFKNNTDTLRLNAQDIAQLNLGENFNVNSLNIYAKNVSDLVLESERVKTLGLDLTLSNFRSENKSYNSLNVSASNGSTLNISGSDPVGILSRIDNLVLNTSGKVDVSLENMKLDSVSGNLSDETMIKIPIVYLKKMIK